VCGCLWNEWCVDQVSLALIGDLVEPRRNACGCGGRRGAARNAHYLSNRNRAPEKFTEQDGEERLIQL